MKQNDVNFGATVARFQQFLGQDRYPENIVWLMPEDVSMTGRQFVYVRVPVPAANETRARIMYDEGVTRGRGLLKSTICETEASTYCRVWHPRRAEERATGTLATGRKRETICKDGDIKSHGKASKEPLVLGISQITASRETEFERFSV